MHSHQTSNEEVTESSDPASKESSRRTHNKKLINGYLDGVGSTPLLRLHSTETSHSLQCKLYAKCEFLNPGGSVQTRKALQAIERLTSNRKQGDDTILSLPPVLHKMGIAGAVVAGVYGHPSLCCGPPGNEDKTGFYSRLFTAHGGFLTASPEESEESKLEFLRQFQLLIPGAVVIDDLLEDTSPVLGTIVEEIQADLLRTEKQHSRETEETDTNFDIKNRTEDIPFLIACSDISADTLAAHRHRDRIIIATLDSPISTTALKYPEATCYRVSRESAEISARELMRNEGLLCSIRGGSVLAAALEAINTDFNLKSDMASNVILILEEAFQLGPWGETFIPAHQHKSSHPMSDWWREQVVGDIPNVKSPVILDPSLSIQAAVQSLELLKSDRAVIQCAKTNIILGVTSASHLKAQIRLGTLSPDDNLQEMGAVFRKSHTVRFTSTLGELMKVLLKERFICIVIQQVEKLDPQVEAKWEDMGNVQCISDNNNCNHGAAISSKHEVVLGLITEFDICEYVAGVEEHHLNVPSSWNFQ